MLGLTIGMRFLPYFFSLAPTTLATKGNALLA